MKKIPTEHSATGAALSFPTPRPRSVSETICFQTIRFQTIRFQTIRLQKIHIYSIAFIS